MFWYIQEKAVDGVEAAVLSELSRYNPLDLFSGQIDLMMKALRDLVDVPGVSLQMSSEWLNNNVMKQVIYAIVELTQLPDMHLVEEYPLCMHATLPDECPARPTPQYYPSDIFSLPAQNNLRLFLDGKLVVGGRPDSDDAHSGVYQSGGHPGGGVERGAPTLFASNKAKFHHHSFSALHGTSPDRGKTHHSSADDAHPSSGPDERLLKMVCTALRHEGRIIAQAYCSS